MYGTDCPWKLQQNTAHSGSVLMCGHGKNIDGHLQISRCGRKRLMIVVSKCLETYLKYLLGVQVEDAYVCQH